MATPIPANQAEMSIDDAVRATGGTLTSRGEGSDRVRGFTTDSRAVVPGGAFVALRGETHDGHAFASKAVDAGARLVVVDKGRGPVGSKAAVLEVDDTLEAWGALGRSHLRAWRAARKEAELDARVVAITGSAGKTTTKEICALLLGIGGPTFRTEGNLNNRVGVPAVAFCVEREHAFVVLELGMSEPGEIAKLVSIVEPDVAIVLNVGVAHAEGVGGGREAIAREKGSIIEGLSPEGIAVLNLDDDFVMAQAPRTRGRLVTFGRTLGADYHLRIRESRELEGSRLTVSRKPDTTFKDTNFAAELPLLGAAAAIDFVAALAAAEGAIGRALPGFLVNTTLKGLRPVAGRAALRTLADDIVLVDDTYNANPASVLAAVETLYEIGHGRRKIVVFGEMKELGDLAREEHERVGEAFGMRSVSLAIGCGGMANVALEAARAMGVETVACASADEAAKVAVERVEPGDAVLVKGSRSVGTEKVVQALVAARGAKG